MRLKLFFFSVFIHADSFCTDFIRRPCLDLPGAKEEGEREKKPLAVEGRLTRKGSQMMWSVGSLGSGGWHRN